MLKWKDEGLLEKSHMTKFLWVSLGMFICPLVLADEELPPVSKMFFNGVERHEMAMVATVATRCGTLNLVVGEIIARDTSDTATVASFREYGNGLLMIGLYTNAALMKLRGADVEMAVLQERALNSQKMFMEIYGERMERNQARTGEMLSGDEVIKSDLEFCKSLTILTSDEWINTLQTNNWDYWDETFQ
jgi:hypothetical protein